MKLLPQIHVEGGAEWLARTATQCLIDEARLSPKPGLVDSRGNGAHHDLTLALMERSAHSLTPTFLQLAQQSWQRPADIALRARAVAMSMEEHSYTLTVQRMGEEMRARQNVAGLMSIMKLVHSEQEKDKFEILLDLMGHCALGWEGDEFTDQELALSKAWLGSFAQTIAGGSSEVQLNVIATALGPVRCTFCVQPSCAGMRSRSACSGLMQTFTVLPLGPMLTPCWAMACSICLRCAGVRLAMDFCICAIAASSWPLWLFMVTLFSHRPGRSFCVWAWAVAQSPGPSTVAERITARARGMGVCMVVRPRCQRRSRQYRHTGRCCQVPCGRRTVGGSGCGPRAAAYGLRGSPPSGAQVRRRTQLLGGGYR